MGVLRYFSSPGDEEALLAEIEGRFDRNLTMREQVASDPQMVERFREFNARFGAYAKPGVLLGMAQVGLSPDDPMAAELAERSGRAKARTADPRPGEAVNGGAWQKVLQVGKGVVRGALTGLAAPFEEVSGAVSAIGESLLDDDAGFNPAFGQAAGSHLRIALSNWDENDGIDLGAGLLPGGQAREQREAEKNRLQLDGTFVTPGRLVPGLVNKVAGRTVIEPGTQPYNIVSGLVDFAANIALDPAGWALGGAAKAGAAAKTFGAAFDELPLAARTMANVSLLHGPRKSIIGESVVDFLERDQGAMVVEALTNAKSANRISKGFGGKIPLPLAKALADADSPEAVKAILAETLGPYVARKPKADDFETGFIDRTRNTARLPGVSRNLNGLRFAQLQPDQLLNWNEPEKAVANVDAFLRSIKIPDADVNALTDELIGVIAADKFDFAGANAVIGKVRERTVREIVLRTIPETDEIIAARKAEEAALSQWNATRRRLTDNEKAADFPRPATPELDKLRAAEKKADKIASLTSSQWADVERQARAYLLDEAGKPILPPWESDVLKIGDEVFPQEGGVPSLLVHTRDDFSVLPDVEGIRREMTWLAPLWDTPVIGDMADGAVKLLTSATHLWSRVTVLRAALAVRVGIDEQTRIAVHGDASMFSHPVQWALYRAGRKGTVDPSGQAFTTDIPEYAAALSNQMKWTPDGNKSFDRAILTGDWFPRPTRQAGQEATDLHRWASYLGRFAHDPLAREVVRRHLDGDTLDDIAEALASGDLSHFRVDLESAFKGARGEGGLSDVATAKSYVSDTIWRGVTVGTGGDYANGIAGNQDLLRFIADGDIDGIPLTVEASARVGADPVMYDAPELLAALRPHTDAMPAFLPGPRMGSERPQSAKDVLDKVFDLGFEWMLNRPRDWTTIDPFMKEQAWKAADRILPYASRDVQTKVIENARKAGFSEKEIQALGKRARTSTGQIRDVGTFTKLTHAEAFDAKKKLLYDLARRRQWSQINKAMFPFAEPWADFFSTMFREVKANPKAIRRGQQLVEGARGSGFFYTDPQSGEEKFAYPGGHLVTKMLGLPGQVDLTGYASGVNLATTGFLPGIGPAISLPAGRLMPEKPSFDGLRQILFPFGEPETGTVGSTVDAILPAWFRKFQTAVNGDPESDRIFGNTVIETMQALSASGDYDDAQGLISAEGQQRLERDAIKYAKRLYWVRALAQTTLPTGPQAQFTVDTPEGAFTLFALSQEMRKFQDEDYDSALTRFVERFGFGPTLATQPKSKSLAARSTDVVGAAWERDNADLVSKYRRVIGLFAPGTPEDKFDYQAYAQQLRTGDRAKLRPLDVLILQNNVLGRMAMDQAKATLGEAASTATGRAVLARLREQLRQDYPGFGDTPGIPKGADTPTLIADMRRAAVDPKLKDTAAARSVREYLRLRDTALAEARDLYGVTTLSGKRASPLRAWLRFEADELMGRTPEFADAFNRVFARELDEPTEVAA